MATAQRATTMAVLIAVDPSIQDAVPTAASQRRKGVPTITGTLRCRDVTTEAAQPSAKGTGRQATTISRPISVERAGLRREVEGDGSEDGEGSREGTENDRGDPVLPVHAPVDGGVDRAPEPHDHGGAEDAE